MLKRILRVVVCFLLICCLIINISPIRAEATGAGLATTWAAFAVAPEIAISAAIIALGVTVAVGSAVVFGSVVSECEQYLVDNGYISGDLVDVYRADQDSKVQYMISRELVEVIRSWLFDSGTVTETVSINTSGFSSPLLGTSKDSYGPYASVNALCGTYPSEFTRIIYDLGIMEKVAVFDIGNTSSAYLIGLYWGADGRLMQGAFENPLGQAHASLYGVYSFNDLTLESSGLATFAIKGYAGYDCGVFYSKSYAEAMPDFVTSRYFAVDWSTEFKLFNISQYGTTNVWGISVFEKKSSDSTWSGKTQWQGKYSAGGKYYSSYPISASDIVWDSATSSTFTVSEGLTMGQIAPQAQSFDDGYSTWASGAKTLPTLRDGVQTDAESAYLALGFGDSLEDTLGLTQSQIQSGTAVGTDTGTGTGTGTATDAVTATGLKGWLDTIRLTLVSGFSDLKSSISEFFSPSGTVDSYAVDLTSFFPFCIPFDLYDFLNLFLAEPEAPYLEFDIDFPYMNEPWHLVIDLSAWDGVAQLLRTLELVLFIVGLGMVTREKFLRG